jgi:proteic killer suppression protein
VAIESFRHKGLATLFVSGRSRKIGAQHRKQALLILDHLAAATELKDLENVRRFHTLRGDQTRRFSMWVTGNYRITFGWRGGHAIEIDFEDYH